MALWLLHHKMNMQDKMTRAEMLKLLEPHRYYESCDVAEHKDALRDALAQLLDETRWIPVSEKLPEEGTPCLIATKFYDCEVAFGVYKKFHEKTPRFWHASDELAISIEAVTHWMRFTRPED